VQYDKAFQLKVLFLLGQTYKSSREMFINYKYALCTIT